MCKLPKARYLAYSVTCLALLTLLMVGSGAVAQQFEPSASVASEPTGSELNQVFFKAALFSMLCACFVGILAGVRFLCGDATEVERFSQDDEETASSVTAPWNTSYYSAGSGSMDSLFESQPTNAKDDVSGSQIGGLFTISGLSTFRVGGTLGVNSNTPSPSRISNRYVMDRGRKVLISDLVKGSDESSESEVSRVRSEDFHRPGLWAPRRASHNAADVPVRSKRAARSAQPLTEKEVRDFIRYGFRGAP